MLEPIPPNPLCLKPPSAQSFRTILMVSVALGLLAGPQRLIPRLLADSPRPRKDRSDVGISQGRTRSTLPGGARRAPARPGTPSERIVRIDDQFLRRKAAGPIILNHADTTYVLDRDIHTSATAFVIGASGVTLNLNGHEVIFGDFPPPKILNGGFEDGSGRSVPGWDLEGAPQAAIGPNTSYLSGKQVLRLRELRGRRQRLVSAPIIIQRGDRTYAAVVTPGGQARDGTKLRVSVLEAGSGRTIAAGESRNVERGFSAVAHFRIASQASVRLQIDVTPAADAATGSDKGGEEPDGLDLDDAMILPSFNYGLLATNTWSGEIKGWTTLSRSDVADYRKAANFTLRNGKIRKGPNDGYACMPLFCNDLPGLVVEDVETFTRGVDTQSLSADHATGTVSIRGSTFTEETWLITDRMANFSTLLLTNIKGPLRIERNTLLHSPQIGINVGFNDPKYPVKVLGNLLEQRAVATNAYGIVVAGLQGFEIAENRILAENGRGIDVDGFSPEPVRDGLIRNNHVEVKERLNREYPVRGEARALRLRNNVDAMGPHRNLQIVNNVFIARTGPGLCQKAFGARISYMNKNNAMTDAGIVIRGNTFTALVATDDPEYHAEAFVIDTLDAGIRPTIDHNVFESNDISLAIGDTEAGDNNDLTLVSNTFKRAGQPSRNYVGIRAGYWTERINRVRLLDNRLDGTPSAPFAWSGEGVKQVEVGRIATLLVKSVSGEPVANANVKVTTKGGFALFSGRTDRDGNLVIPVLTTVYRQSTSDPKAIQTEAAGVQLVTATFGERSASTEVGPDTSVSLTLK